MWVKCTQNCDRSPFVTLNERNKANSLGQLKASLCSVLPAGVLQRSPHIGKLCTLF